MSDRKTRQKASQRTPVLDAYIEFIASREAANVSPRTIGYYYAKLRPFCVWCGSNGVSLIGDVSAKHIRDYIITLRDRALSPWTMHGAARAIKAFLRFCQSEGMIADVPPITMPKLPKELPQPYTAAEVERLIGSCECERDRAIIYMLVDTGLRASELIALDGRDVDISSGLVMVRGGKGAKDRAVYFGSKTKGAILRYWREVGTKPAKDDPFFVTRVAPIERLSFFGLASMLRRLGKRADVQTCTPHRFRRTFAVWSLRAGMDVFTLQRLMGHEDLGTTRRYVALVDDDLKAAHKRFGAADSFLK